MDVVLAPASNAMLGRRRFHELILVHFTTSRVCFAQVGCYAEGGRHRECLLASRRDPVQLARDYRDHFLHGISHIAFGRAEVDGRKAMPSVRGPRPWSEGARLRASRDEIRRGVPGAFRAGRCRPG